MIERKGRENATPNSENAEMGTPPLKAGRLGSTAGSMKPFWIMCGCFVVSPLPSVGVLLIDTGGSCIQVLSGWSGPPTVRDFQTRRKRRDSGYFNIGVKRTLSLKALDKQQIILMSLKMNWATLFLLYKWKLWHWMIVILSQKCQLHGFSLSTCLVVCLMRFVKCFLLSASSLRSNAQS